MIMTAIVLRFPRTVPITNILPIVVKKKKKVIMPRKCQHVGQFPRLLLIL